jgi:dTDP-4-dehydrorhamnose reductase
MGSRRRVIVTGAGGRLGSVLVRLLTSAGWSVDPWTRDEFDLDAPRVDPARLHEAAVVVHAAAWTDVDGCARDPDAAMRRNGAATRILAEACAHAGAALFLVSTNEVFDGTRSDGVGYAATETPRAANAYGESKLAAERWATQAAGSASGRLAIVRTAWLFGEGKPDFPAKIIAAALAARADSRPLRLVRDEIGTPTSVADLAGAIVDLLTNEVYGIHHVVNAGIASRAEWARDVLARAEIDVPIELIELADIKRPSTPPRWGVLEATPLPAGPLRSWRDAMAERMPSAAPTR